MWHLCILNISNTELANFWKHKTIFQLLFWYQSFSRFHWKLMWSASFAMKSRISWHAKGVLSYTVYINHYDTFYVLCLCLRDWLLSLSCFTSTRTIVGMRTACNDQDHVRNQFDATQHKTNTQLRHHIHVINIKVP